MAALLRHGARRLGGSVVQRTRAAFTTRAGAGAGAEEGRPLIPEHLRPRPTTDGQDVFRLVQERKEELYDLLSLMEGTPVCNKKNRQLLKFLSAQVKPRPDDSLWRQMRASERMKDAARAIVVVSGCVLGYKMFSLIVARGKEMQAQAARKQEQ